MVLTPEALIGVGRTDGLFSEVWVITSSATHELHICIELNLLDPLIYAFDLHLNVFEVFCICSILITAHSIYFLNNKHMKLMNNFYEK